MDFHVYLHPFSEIIKNERNNFLIMSTDHSYDNYGIISLKLNMILNEPGTLEVTFKKDHPYFEKIFSEKALIISVTEEHRAIYESRREIWRGIEAKRELDFYGNLYILFDGVLSFTKYLIGKLPDFLKKENEGDNGTIVGPQLDILKDFFSTITKVEDGNLLYPKNFNFDIANNDVISRNHYIFEKVDNLYDNLYNVIKTYLIGKSGGYLIPSFPDQNGSWDIHYLSSSYLPKFNDQTYFYKVVEKGKNIIDFKKEISLDDVYTGMFPIGKDGLLLTNNKSIIDENCVFLDYNDLDLVYRLGKRIMIKEFPNISKDLDLKTTAKIELRNVYSKLNLNLRINMFDEDILSYDKFILLPGEVFTYLNSSGYHLNVLCTEFTMDFLNPEKSVWKSGYDVESITSAMNEKEIVEKIIGDNNFKIDISIADYFENFID